jgi:hypothetical protein
MCFAVLDYSTETGTPCAQVNALGIPYPLYGDLFPEHVARSDNKFCDDLCVASSGFSILQQGCFALGRALRKQTLPNLRTSTANASHALQSQAA